MIITEKEAKRGKQQLVAKNIPFFLLYFSITCTCASSLLYRIFCFFLSSICSSCIKSFSSIVMLFSDVFDIRMSLQMIFVVVNIFIVAIVSR
jgi:hypothetical protein